MGARSKHDAGFTLIELLVSIGIVGIIVPAIAAAFILGFNTTGQTTDRITDSADLQIAAAYFAKDVQSSDSVSKTDTQCSGVTPAARFAWVDNGVSKVASYYTDVSSGKTRLLRAYCEDGGSAKVFVLVRQLSATAPVVTCDGSANCPTTTLKVDLQATTNAGYNFTLSGTRRTA